MKSYKISILTAHGHATGVVQARSKEAAIMGILAHTDLQYRMIARHAYARAVSLVGSTNAGWFNVEASKI